MSYPQADESKLTEEQAAVSGISTSLPTSADSVSSGSMAPEVTPNRPKLLFRHQQGNTEIVFFGKAQKITSKMAKLNVSLALPASADSSNSVGDLLQQFFIDLSLIRRNGIEVYRGKYTLPDCQPKMKDFVTKLLGLTPGYQLHHIGVYVEKIPGQSADGSSSAGLWSQKKEKRLGNIEIKLAKRDGGAVYPAEILAINIHVVRKADAHTYHNLLAISDSSTKTFLQTQGPSLLSLEWPLLIASAQANKRKRFWH